MQKTLVKNDLFEILITFYGLRHFVVYPNTIGGRHGRDRMVVGFTTTYAISAYHHKRCELESR